MLMISKTVEFDAGHRVPSHRGMCRSPHGHRYKVIAHVSGQVQPDGDSPEAGMVTDFSFLKEQLDRLVVKVYDHAFLVWKHDDAMLSALAVDPTWKVVVMEHIPTAENLARAITSELVGALLGLPFCVEAVEVYETPTSVASCTPTSTGAMH